MHLGKVCLAGDPGDVPSATILSHAPAPRHFRPCTPPSMGFRASLMYLPCFFPSNHNNRVAEERLTHIPMNVCKWLRQVMLGPLC